MSKIVCLFGVLRPTRHREFLTHLETLPLPVKDYYILTYAWHSRPLSCEGSLACHTVHGVSAFNGHLRGPLTPTVLPSVCQWNCHYLFKDLDLLQLGFEHPIFHLRGERSDPLNHRRGLSTISANVLLSIPHGVQL